MTNDTILTLVLAGYTLYPKKSFNMVAPNTIPASEIDFSTEHKLMSCLRKYEKKGQLLDCGWVQDERLYALVNQYNHDLTYKVVAIHQDHIQQFGSPNVFVFDWSGTISDDRKPVYAANMAMLEKFGIEKMTFEVWLKGTDTTIGQFMQNHGVNIDKEEIHNIYGKAYNDQMKLGNFPTVYPDAEEVLQYLKEHGKRIAVISSHPHDNLVNEAEKYDLAKYIDFIDGDARDKRSELLALAERFCEKPQNMIYIGDMAHDIIAANHAGMHSVGVSTGYHSLERLAKEKSEFLFESLNRVNFIKAKPTGGIQVVYPIDQPGLMGSLSAREMFALYLSQEHLEHFPESTKSNDGSINRQLSIIE